MMNLSTQEYIVAAVVIVCVVIVIRRIWLFTRRVNDKDNPCSSCGCGCGGSQKSKKSSYKTSCTDKILPEDNKKCDR